MTSSYSKSEKLKSRKTIERLFTEGKTIGVYPIRLFYLELPKDEKHRHQAAVSVSKRKFKQAVQRNFIKRLLRESYRLNKQILLKKQMPNHALMFVYVGKEKPDFHTLQHTMKQLLEKFMQELQK